MECAWRDERKVRDAFQNSETSEEAGDILGCSKTTALKWAKRFGVDTGVPGPNKGFNVSKEALAEMYLDRGMTTVEIAEKYDVAPRTISKRLSKYDIPTRNIGDYSRQNYVSMHTDKRGYEKWRVNEGKGNGYSELRVHRLVAVAEYGFDAVAGKDVHHISNIPWDNRPENLIPMGHAEHSSHHRSPDS